jgi:hypothetical protein
MSFSTTGRRSFAFGQRRDDLLVLDQRSRHVGEHCFAVLGRAVEATTPKSVTHGFLL